MLQTTIYLVIPKTKKIEDKIHATSAAVDTENAVVEDETTLSNEFIHKNKKFAVTSPKTSTSSLSLGFESGTASEILRL